MEIGKLNKQEKRQLAVKKVLSKWMDKVKFWDSVLQIEIDSVNEVNESILKKVRELII